MPEEESVSSTQVRYYIFSAIAGSMLVGMALVGWLVVHNSQSGPNPFPTSTAAAMKFPLYYPTQLPDGFKIDRKSLNTPKDGVVMLTLVGPNGAKLYMTEEARPTTFNLGGFYDQLEGLKEVGVSDGAVAVGTLKGGKTLVASRANNKTWILCNTTADIPKDQLISMLQSLTSSR